MNKTIVVIVITLIALGVWVALSKPATAPRDGAQTPPALVETNMPVPGAEGNAQEEMVVESVPVKEFTVAGSNFSFAPATMTVKKGDHVRVVFQNTGGFHDFRIDEFAVATKQIKDGERETVEFTADKAGSFEYYCSVGKHRAMGMKGTLTVTE